MGERRLAELPNLLQLASLVDRDVKEEVDLQIAPVLEFEAVDLMAEGRVAVGDHGVGDDLPSRYVLVGCRGPAAKNSSRP